MKLFLLVVFSFFFILGSLFSQQLIINEVSQGTGSREYVEFVVMGNPTCLSTIPCADLRGVVIDDNDGYFSTTFSGSGIADGALRFANTSFWSCIPQGTIIVVYNESETNPALPPNDASMTDGNCRLILPANSMLLEGQTSSPSSSNPFIYPTTGWTAGAGQWSSVSMANSGDSFQIRTSVASVAPTYSISYGSSNTNNASIYFSGAATNKVFSLTNTTNVNPAVQSNWSSGTVGTNETPGFGNSPANSAWISSMNPQCGSGAPVIQVSLS